TGHSADSLVSRLAEGKLFRVRHGCRGIFLSPTSEDAGNHLCALQRIAQRLAERQRLLRVGLSPTRPDGVEASIPGHRVSGCQAGVHSVAVLAGVESVKRPV